MVVTCPCCGRKYHLQKKDMDRVIRLRDYKVLAGQKVTEKKTEATRKNMEKARMKRLRKPNKRNAYILLDE